MIRVADYIMARLAEFGVEVIFMITGGGAMHLNDAAGRRLRYFCNHHEQASAIAAEGYSRASGRPAVVLVTTGPGGLNTLTGVMGQWTDSVPVIYLSGQVKFETTIQSCRELGLRQLGDQEVNIVEVVRPLTKFAESVINPMDIRRALEQAWYTASSGRPGPVWLDIPMDVQGRLSTNHCLLVTSLILNRALMLMPLKLRLTSFWNCLLKQSVPLLLQGVAFESRKVRTSFLSA